MGVKVSFFYQLQGDRLGGWSETFWNSNNQGPTVANLAQSLGNRLSIAKASNVLWTRTRISVPGSPRNSITYIQNPAQSSGSTTTSTSTSPDYQVTKWLLQLQGQLPPVNVPGSGGSKQWFGGVVDNSIVNAYLQPSVVISSLWPSAAALLTTSSNGWCVNVLNPSFPPISIISINPATGVVTTAGAYSFGAATVIRISRVRGLTYANGLWTWAPISNSNNTFQLLNWVPQSTTMVTSPKAAVRPQLYILNPILSATMIRASNHRVGRPTGQFGGKRKKSIAH